MENAFIDLGAPRTVSFKTEGGQAVTYEFRRIEEKDWRSFFAGVIVESETVGKQRVDRIDSRDAGLGLVDAALVSVSGYQTRDGAAVSSWPNWKQRLPYGHRVRAANLLQDVKISTTPRVLFLEPDTDEVVLRAAWGSATPGTMLYFDGLVHRFTPPSAEDARKFNRAMSEVRVVGGSRNGRTVYPAKHGLLADLYDRLIVGVEGYAVGGRPLAAREDIVRNMDAFHKMAAAQQLFAMPEVPEEEE